MVRILRGEIYWADLNRVRGREQAGLRPVLILSHDLFNPARGTKIAACCVLAVALLLAQPDWKTVDNLPGVDFSGLSPVKTRALLRLLRNHDCACGCGMKVAECRVKDPDCSWSKGLAAAMADAIRAGKDENEAIAAANASKWAKGPEPPKLLEDPVTFPPPGRLSAVPRTRC